MTHIYIMSTHKPIRIYMWGLILGVNILYRLFCFFKLFPMVGKGLTPHVNSYGLMEEVGTFITHIIGIIGW